MPFNDIKHDNYGFPIDESIDDNVVGNGGDKLELERIWHSLIKHPEPGSIRCITFPPKCTRIKGLVRQGIPDSIRGSAWFYYSGSYDLMLKSHTFLEGGSLYWNLVNKGERLSKTTSKNILVSIEKDLPRTFPENIYFNSSPEDTQKSKLPQLRRVLIAFAHYDPTIGYCQALNYIAGVLLLVVPDEEMVFWLLVNLLHHILPPDVYVGDDHKMALFGARAEQETLWKLMERKMKVIDFIGKNVIEKAGMPPLSVITTTWFMKLYVDVLPIQTVLRVWDCLFYEGSKILFRVALTLMKIAEPGIIDIIRPLCSTAINNASNIQKEPHRFHSLTKSITFTKTFSSKLTQIKSHRISRILPLSHIAFAYIRDIPKSIVLGDVFMRCCFDRFNGGCGSLSMDLITQLRSESREKLLKSLEARSDEEPLDKKSEESNHIDSSLKSPDKSSDLRRKTMEDKTLPRLPDSTTKEIKSEITSDEKELNEKTLPRLPKHESIYFEDAPSLDVTPRLSVDLSKTNSQRNSEYFEVVTEDRQRLNENQAEMNNAQDKNKNNDIRNNSAQSGIYINKFNLVTDLSTRNQTLLSGPQSPTSKMSFHRLSELYTTDDLIFSSPDLNSKENSDDVDTKFAKLLDSLIEIVESPEEDKEIVETVERMFESTSSESDYDEGIINGFKKYFKKRNGIVMNPNDSIPWLLKSKDCK